MKTNDGGPAFPVIRMPLDPDTILNRPGMSLRDWFAGQALAGGFMFGQIPEDISKDIYALADAMIAERERSE